jgi:RNA polymerase sigma factor (sigma-70 family)
VQAQREEAPLRSDVELVEAVRHGNQDAYGELYSRYSVPALQFARTLLGSRQGADDLVSEAFSKILNRIVHGGGPDRTFRSYLMMTVRTTLYKEWAAERMIDRRVEVAELHTPTTDADAVADRLESDLLTRALHSLPIRSQQILHYLEVEGRAPGSVAESFGIKRNAVYALAFRAREALRLAYLQVHVNTDVDDACKEAANNLAAWLCGRLTCSLRLRVQCHVECCGRCANSVAELSDLLNTVRPAIARRITGEIDVPGTLNSEFGPFHLPEQPRGGR